MLQSRRDALPVLRNLVALLRAAFLAGAAGLLALAGPDDPQDPKFVPPPRRRPEGFQAVPFEDKQLERHQEELRWMGGRPSPAHQEYKRQLATQQLERFAPSFPRARAKGREAATIQASSAVSWTCIGPTKGVSTYSGVTNPDIDSGRIAPNGLAISSDGQTLYLASSNGGLWKTTTASRADADAVWSWTPLTDTLPMASSTGNIPVGAVALSPSGARLFIGAGDFADSHGKGFFRSTDGGTTWTETAKSDLCGLYAADYISCLFPVDENTILAGGNAGLYRSTDGGATFGSDSVGNRVLGPNGYGDRIWSVEQVGSSSQNLVASLQVTGTPNTGSAWYSSDGGATWSQATITGAPVGANSALGRITLKSNRASGNLNVWGIVQITPGRAMLKGILRSTDGGRNYTYIPDASPTATLFKAAGAGDGDQGEYNQCLAVSPTGTSAATTVVFTGSNQGFYRSTDGGSTWTLLSSWYAWTGTPLYSHADKHTAIWSPDGSALYVGTDGGLSVYWDPFRATPPVGTVSDPSFVDNRHNEGLSTHLIYHLGSTNAATPADAKYRVTVGLQDNSTRRRVGATLATSAQFDEAYATGDGFGTLLHPLDGNKLIVSGYTSNLGYSIDGGATFYNGNTGIDKTGGAPFHTRVEPGRADATGNTAYTATSYKLFKTTDFGQHWTACAMGGFPTAYPAPYIRAFTSSSLDPLKLAIVDATHCWISADGGATWTDKGAVHAAGGAEVALGYIWFDTGNDNVLYAASVYAGWGPTIQHLWRSADGGTTWQNIEGGAFPSGHGMNLGGPVHIIQNDPTNPAALLAGTDFGLYLSTDSGATWNRYGAGLPLVRVPDFYIAPDASFIRAATYGRGVWESTGPAQNPAILAQPLDTTAYVTLDTAFSVEARGAVSYRWQVDAGSGWVDLADGAPYSGTGTAALAITGVSAGLNGYRYRVVVTGVSNASAPILVSSAATLTVALPPSPAFTTQPASALIAAGSGCTFSVQATWTTSYQWQANTGSGWTDLANGGAYSGATTATLTVSGATVVMTGTQFRLVLTGAAAASPRTATSSVVTLTVVAAPSFSSQPASALIVVGGATTFSATVTGATSYRWQSKMGAGAWTDLSDGAPYSGSSTASLTVTAAGSGLDGLSLRLVATGPLSLSTTSNTVTLAVKDPAAITVQPVDASSAYNTHAINLFTVTATGYNLSYQWQILTGGVWANITDAVNYGGMTSASLSIWVSPGMNLNQYRVVVTGAVGSAVTSSTATLTVLCYPVLATQPADTTIATGANATLTASAANAGWFLWQMSTNNGSTWASVPGSAPYSSSTSVTAGIASTSLTITAATAGMNGYKFRAVATSACAGSFNTNSSAATLYVGASPAITGQPASASIATGANAAFTVVATAALTYQWQVNTGGGFANVSNGGVYSGATTATLTITGATLAMNGAQYQVLVTGLASQTVTSSAAALSVNDPPAITSQPQATATTAGGSASFAVSASGSGLGYQWRVNTGSGYTNLSDGGIHSGVTTATLGLTGVTAGMSGYLYQVVVTGTGALSVTSTAATLTVNVPPSISANPQNATVAAGGSTSFSVTAAGTSLSYQWQVNTGSGYGNITNGGVYTGATTATLSITGATAGMSGYLYQVIVSGAAAPTATSTAATLTVDVPPSISAQPLSQTVTAGNPVTFSVTATGTAPLSYQWRKGGAAIGGQTASSYTIASTVIGDAGSYDVVVANVAGSATSVAATLTVNPAPVAPAITTQPLSQTVTAGNPVTFTVAATGTAPLSYQWRKGGAAIGGQTASSYTIATTAVAAAGSYDVVVTNVAGAATSAAASLTVNLKSEDLNGDSAANVLDLATFFRFYAPGVPIANCPADLNGDGFVDDADLALLLAGM